MNLTPGTLRFVVPIDPPKSMEELLERQHFVAPLDPKQHKLTEVLTGYTFAKQVPCGLSSCQQRHFHGLLVKTASGHETNIGHVCGKSHFGEDFVTAHSNYSRSVERRDAVARLESLKGQRQGALEKATELTEGVHGVRWLLAVRKALEGRIGKDAYSHLCLRASRDDYKVTRVKELTPTELDMAIQNTGKRRDELRYVHEPIGHLASMKSLITDFRAILIDGISEPFKTLDSLDANKLDTKSIQKGLKVFSGYENKLKETQALLTQARQMLAPDNLTLLGEAIAEFERGRKKGPNAKPSDPLEGWASTAKFKLLELGKLPS